MKNSRLLLAALAACCTASGLPAADIKILPDAVVELHGKHARQQLLAQVTADGVQRDWTSDVSWI